MPKLLSKSLYLKGRQCPRRLWLGARQPPEPSLESEDIWEMREAEGAEMERLVESLYHNPVRISDPPEDDADQAGNFSAGTGEAERTRTALQGTRPIFQAYLVAEGLLAISDILEHRQGGWFLWEIKASTKPVALHDHDLAFQVHVARRMGLNIVGAGLWLLNKEYRRGEILDPRLLLVNMDRTVEVEALQSQTEQTIQNQCQVLRAGEPPHAVPGPRCKANRDSKAGDRPSSCGHLGPSGYCGAQLPEDWIGYLPRISQGTVEHLANYGVLDLKMLVDRDYGIRWTPDQLRVIEGAAKAAPVVDEEAIQAELSQLRWPIACIDFEFDPGMAIPRFPGSRPYDRVPFQWSMVIQKSKGGEVVQPEPFLWLETGDPRRPFLESLRRALPEKGSIVVHSRAAEWTVLNQAAEFLGGEFTSWVQSLDARIFDTVALLRAGYYHPLQRGSYSIKKIAPALLGHGYEDLEIQDGMAAVVAWKKAIAPDLDPDQKLALRESLLKYCEKDTVLLLEIVKFFFDKIGV